MMGKRDAAERQVAELETVEDGIHILVKRIAELEAKMKHETMVRHGAEGNEQDAMDMLHECQQYAGWSQFVEQRDRAEQVEAELAEAVIERDMNYKTMVLYMEKKEQAEAALAERDRDRDMLFGRLAHAEEFIRRHHLDQEFGADLRARAAEGIDDA